MLELNSVINKFNSFEIKSNEDDCIENEIKINKLLDKIKYNISNILDNKFNNTEVGEVIDYAVSSVGKMIRSRLLIMFASNAYNFEDLEDEVCELASLVELIHLSSLIHDDIIDDANFRRKKLSLQAKFGKSAAVYAGDFIISRVYMYLAKNSLRKVSLELTQSIEDMCAGEIGQNMCKYKSNITIDQYIDNIKGKTCSLFKTSCLLGASFADFTAKDLKNIEQFGMNFGLMFQLIDDLLDYTSNLNKAGKDCRKDFIEGIYTYPIICLIEKESSNIELRRILIKNQNHQLEDEDFMKVVSLANKSGAIDLTKKEIKRLAAINQEILDNLACTSFSRYLSKSILKKIEVI
ncbi:MAG: polyprenyl synthetase family protein [Peptoniphilaceae bacterium]|nr:polyprenyl synthetase family protein [Peptoniphilaceae bacterium]MDY6019729.1 polyprenyl synthetase family protein [Anaerococcus sp.]